MSESPREPTPPITSSNGANASDRTEGPDDSHIAFIIIAGIVLMFVVGFLILVVSMAGDWQ